MPAYVLDHEQQELYCLSSKCSVLQHEGDVRGSQRADELADDGDSSTHSVQVAWMNNGPTVER